MTYNVFVGTLNFTQLQLGPFRRLDAVHKASADEFFTMCQQALLICQSGSAVCEEG